LWSLPGGAPLRTHIGDGNALAITPNGKLLVSGGQDKLVRLWSLPDGALLKTLPGHTGGVLALSISPDGKTLASAGADKTIKLWSLPDGAPLPTCLMDVMASQPEAKGIQYSRAVASYTQACGTPIPAGAVCTCNCVAGGTCACVGHKSCSCVGHVAVPACSCVGHVAAPSCSCVGHSSCSCVSYSSGGGGHYWYPN
jgi:WD40 repeat protein